MGSDLLGLRVLGRNNPTAQQAPTEINVVTANALAAEQAPSAPAQRSDNRQPPRVGNSTRGDETAGPDIRGKVLSVSGDGNKFTVELSGRVRDGGDRTTTPRVREGEERPGPSRGRDVGDRPAPPRGGERGDRAPPREERDAKDRP